MRRGCLGVRNPGAHNNGEARVSEALRSSARHAGAATIGDFLDVAPTISPISAAGSPIDRYAPTEER
jgi:hypothetical protein